MKWNSHNQGRGSEWTKCWLLIQENPAEGASRRGSCASPLLPWCWQNLMLYLVNVHSDTPAGNLIVDFFHQYPTRPQRFFFFFSASKHTFGGRTAKYNNQVHVNMRYKKTWIWCFWKSFYVPENREREVTLSWTVTHFKRNDLDHR